MSYDALAKVVLLGPSGVGKSNLLLRITDDRFTIVHELTIGVEFGYRMVKVEDKALKLQIWDTAGQESFRSITRGYYRGAHVACVAWDASKLEQINHLESWVQEAKRQVSEGARIIFVRTKSDLDNTASNAQIAEQIEKVKAIALRCEIDDPIILATSAKTGAGIKELTTKIAEVALPLVSLREKDDAVRVVKPSEPFFLTERLAKMKHSRKPRGVELKACFAKVEPSEQDFTWLLLHLDSVEENCQTARDIRKYCENRNISLEYYCPKTGPVVELLKLLDEEERRFAPKLITLLFFASYSDKYVEERDKEREFILKVAKNIHYLGKDNAYKDLVVNNIPKAVLAIVDKHSPGLMH